MHREFLRREHPEATESELGKLLAKWLKEQHEHEWDESVFKTRARVPR